MFDDAPKWALLGDLGSGAASSTTPALGVGEQVMEQVQEAYDGVTRVCMDIKRHAKDLIMKVGAQSPNAQDMSRDLSAL